MLLRMKKNIILTTLNGVSAILTGICAIKHIQKGNSENISYKEKILNYIIGGCYGIFCGISLKDFCDALLMPAPEEEEEKEVIEE